MIELNKNKNIIIGYVRKSNGRRIATFVGQSDKTTGGRVMIGFSKARSTDRFNNEEGYNIAKTRIARQLEGKEQFLPKSLKKEYTKFIHRCNRYFGVKVDENNFPKIICQ